MLKVFKEILRPAVPSFVVALVRKQWERNQIKLWHKSDCPVPPPPIIKHITIREYKEKYGHHILIETGTYMGEMVEAQKGRFKKVISIELGVDLYERAQKKFIKDENVSIVQGDSGKVLPQILKDINEPVIFWLDGHYSAGITAKGDKECPIFEELQAIFNSRKFDHVLLIDDARCFNGEGDYPTVEELTAYIKSKDERYRVEVKHDIIRCTI